MNKLLLYSLIQGCTVIGCAGTEDKLKYLRDLGFDHVFNYKTDDLDTSLRESAPNGIDIFYDNVSFIAIFDPEDQYASVI